jgi:hypothetical protein
MANGLLNLIQASNGLLDTKEASDFLGVNDKSLAPERVLVVRKSGSFKEDTKVLRNFWRGYDARN